MDKRIQQNHIRAAREWLGRAEDSLAHDDDVQGDLKLMLARAELARVGQSPRSHRLKSWGSRGLAVGMAVVFAWLFLWKPAAVPEEAAPPEVIQQSSAENRTAASQSGQLPQQVDRTEPSEQVAQADPVGTQRINELPEPVHQQAVETEPAKAAEPSVPHPRVPDKEKQQLMQSAGKILRQ